MRSRATAKDAMLRPGYAKEAASARYRGSSIRVNVMRSTESFSPRS
jgi:hypothetical protein